MSMISRPTVSLWWIACSVVGTTLGSQITLFFDGAIFPSEVASLFGCCLGFAIGQSTVLLLGFPTGSKKVKLALLWFVATLLGSVLALGMLLVIPPDLVMTPAVLLFPLVTIGGMALLGLMQWLVVGVYLNVWTSLIKSTATGGFLGILLGSIGAIATSPSLLWLLLVAGVTAFFQIADIGRLFDASIKANDIDQYRKT